MTLNFYSDPGHGWLAVPLTLLQELGLLDKISSYSYMRGKLAHLEEDCDCSLFLAAMRAAGREVKIREHSCSRYSRIRCYSHYSPSRARGALAMARELVVTVPPPDQVARDWTGAPFRYPIPGMTVPR